MSITLPKGTKEFLVVVITDKLGNLEDLDDIDVTFDVVDDAGDAIIFDEAAETVTGEMTILCLVDTAELVEGKYKLFVKPVVEPQVPILGPYHFKVEDYANDDGTVIPPDQIEIEDL